MGGCSSEVKILKLPWSSIEVKVMKVIGGENARGIYYVKLKNSSWEHPEDTHFTTVI